jgi:predicted lactoylglutathione lyase
MEPVAPNLTIVTLGVTDLDRSIAFYGGLGWEQRGDRAQDIVWFRTSGSWVGLFGHDALAEDAALPAVPQSELPRYRGITMALNLASVEEVDAAFVTVTGLGGTVVKPAAPTDFGGYSGYFADPDGHLWELCHNPGFPLDDQGRIEIG